MDFFNYLMVLPNTIALFALSAMVVSGLKARKKKEKKVKTKKERA